MNEKDENYVVQVRSGIVFIATSDYGKAKELKDGLNSIESDRCIVYLWANKTSKKIKALMNIDVIDYKKPMQINAYVPNCYEGVGKGRPHIHNEIQNKTILVDNIWNEGYDCVVNLENTSDFRHNLTIWVTDKENAYYEIVEK